MSDFQISCVILDHENVISQVGINGLAYSVLTVVNWINSHSNSFYTFKGGKRAEVVARQHHTGRWYLTTLPDDTRLNNLDFLPKC
jgi:hypothetical protein